MKIKRGCGRAKSNVGEMEEQAAGGAERERRKREEECEELLIHTDRRLFMEGCVAMVTEY